MIRRRTQVPWQRRAVRSRSRRSYLAPVLLLVRHRGAADKQFGRLGDTAKASGIRHHPWTSESSLRRTDGRCLGVAEPCVQASDPSVHRGMPGSDVCPPVLPGPVRTLYPPVRPDGGPASRSGLLRRLHRVRPPRRATLHGSAHQPTALRPDPRLRPVGGSGGLRPESRLAGPLVPAVLRRSRIARHRYPGGPFRPGPCL